MLVENKISQQNSLYFFHMNLKSQKVKKTSDPKAVKECFHTFILGSFSRIDACLSIRVGLSCKFSSSFCTSLSGTLSDLG